jgi:hypothetical protein
LTTAPEHDAEFCFAIAHCTTHSCTNGWVIATLGGVRTEVIDCVPSSTEKCDEVLLQGITSVVGPNSNVKCGSHVLSIGFAGLGTPNLRL